MIVDLRFENSQQEHVKIIAEVAPYEEYDWQSCRARFFPSYCSLGPHSIKVTSQAFLWGFQDFYQYCKSQHWKLESESDVKTWVRRVYEIQKNSIGDGEQIWGDDLQGYLRSRGFVRELKPFQLRNVQRLAKRRFGASFSVPGAGKTTEALAYFFLKREEESNLLVVAPPNAFCAWDEQIAECAPNFGYSFVRLIGQNRVAKELYCGHRLMITSYDTFCLNVERFSTYLRNHPNTFMFLDESHRVKNINARKTQSVLQVNGHPYAKLVLSGTPMPQKPEDLIPQLQFLMPTARLTANNVIDEFQKYFVRTTALELGIPKIKYVPTVIKLGDIERALYDKMRKLTSKEVSGLSQTDASYLRRMGKSVMNLMQFVSNPASKAMQLAVVDPRLVPYLQSHDSPKIQYVCKRVRELVKAGKKVLVWSTFVSNVELLACRLSDCGAEYIHGKVGAGDEETLGTRENILKKFHDKDSSMRVLVANPAAASEGISLHTVCQYAIYLDRSYNAAQFLQSQDRIHRLGLPQGTEPTVEIVMCENTIDELVQSSLQRKIGIMADALNDASIKIPDCDMPAIEDDEDEIEDGYPESGLSNDDIEEIRAHLGII